MFSIILLIRRSTTGLFSLFLVFYFWIFEKLCHMLLLHMKNSYVLDLMCYIDLLFLVIPHIAYLRLSC